MKRWLGGLIAGTLTIGACAVALQHITRIFLRAESYHISFDNLLSVTAQHSINHFIAQHFNKIQHTALLQAIKNNFPCIQTIATRNHRPGLVRFFISAEQPWVTINEQLVMTTKGSLVPRSCYESPHVAHMPNIKVPETFGVFPYITQQFFLPMHHIDMALLDEFDITWHTPHNVMLTHKIDSWFSIVCHSAQLPNASTLTECQKIKEKIKQTHLEQKKQSKEQKYYRADIRFAHQIVVTQKGETHV